MTLDVKWWPETSREFDTTLLPKTLLRHWVHWSPLSLYINYHLIRSFLAMWDSSHSHLLVVNPTHTHKNQFLLNLQNIQIIFCMIHTWFFSFFFHFLWVWVDLISSRPALMPCGFPPLELYPLFNYIWLIFIIFSNI